MRRFLLRHAASITIVGLTIWLATAAPSAQQPVAPTAPATPAGRRSGARHGARRARR